jgi:ribosomal protein L11 methyltransferase
VTADHEAVEQVSEILSRACPGGVSVEAPFEVLEEGLAARIDARRPATVRGYIAASDAAAATAAVEQVRRDLGHLQAFALRPIGELETRLVHEEDWAEAWKEHFPVQRVGRRIVIQPTWREHVVQPEEVVIRLDPGQAFGTGLHPTTRLVLDRLEQLAESGMVSGRSVVDVGSGSGILSVCAGLLGAASVLAVDTDPLAAEMSASNAASNGLSDRIEARQGSLPLTNSRQFDLVLANLVAGVLVGMADDLSAVTKPEVGRVLASGIFQDRESEVRDAFESAGLHIVGRSVESEWIALDAVRASRP